MSCTRRTFLTAASGLALGTRLAASTTQGAHNRIRVGVVGSAATGFAPRHPGQTKPGEGKGLRPRSQNRGDLRRRFGVAREGAVAGRDPLRARASGWPRFPLMTKARSPARARHSAARC